MVWKVKLAVATAVVVAVAVVVFRCLQGYLGGAGRPEQLLKEREDELATIVTGQQQREADYLARRAPLLDKRTRLRKQSERIDARFTRRLKEIEAADNIGALAAQFSGRGY